jgi:hypothetical protein
MYAKFSKCEFWIDEVSFLGHVIPQQGTRCVELEATNVCNSNTKFPWVDCLLSKIHSDLLLHIVLLCEYRLSLPRRVSSCTEPQRPNDFCCPVTSAALVFLRHQEQERVAMPFFMLLVN